MPTNKNHTGSVTTNICCCVFQDMDQWGSATQSAEPTLHATMCARNVSSNWPCEIKCWDQLHQRVLHGPRLIGEISATTTLRKLAQLKHAPWRPFSRRPLCRLSATPYNNCLRLGGPSLKLLNTSLSLESRLQFTVTPYVKAKARIKTTSARLANKIAELPMERLRIF